MSKLLALCILSLTISNCLCDYPDVQEMSDQDFLDSKPSVHGRLAAFGDVNSDKQTDVFVISDNGTFIYVLLGSFLSPALSLYDLIKLEKPATSVVPADFNGDNIVDLLVTYKRDAGAVSYSLLVYWGNINEKFNTENVYHLRDEFSDEPLVLDANGDMIADLFVTYTNQTRRFLVGQMKPDNRTFMFEPFRTKLPVEELNDLHYPHSHAFIDLTGDGSANLFVTAKKEQLVYEIWNGTDDGLVLHKLIDTSLHFQSDIEFGHATFADFIGNGKEDIVVATCETRDANSCKNGKIWIFADNEWTLFYKLKEGWTFPNSDELKFAENTLHIADFNLDSYPDVMTIVQDEKGIRKAVILYNDPCSSNNCSTLGRELKTEKVLPNSDHAILAAFYDFSMDGTIDVIITKKPNLDELCSLKGYINMIADDVTFLRVQVLTGRSEEAIFGVNVPGPQISYQTTNTSGGTQIGCMGQLSQSAHFSLQLPYVIFGLGRLANFVDSLTVSVPVPLIISNNEEPKMTKIDSKGKMTAAFPNKTISSDSFIPRNHKWPMLIPNSQLYVIPNPLSKPNSWKNKLLVTPSQNMYLTGVVLLSTLGLLLVATLVLHWFERREDKQEKIQEAHRFHFDAM